MIFLLADTFSFDDFPIETADGNRLRGIPALEFPGPLRAHPLQQASSPSRGHRFVVVC